MICWQRHWKGPVVILALVLSAACAKEPVAYQRSAASVAPPKPAAGAPTPAPGALAPEPVAPAPPIELGSGSETTLPLGGGPAAGSGAPLVGAQRPAPDEFRATQALKDIHFEFGAYTIREEDAATLRANADWMKAHPGTAVLIEGHCDERGTTEFNLALGQRRAQAARDFLVGQGISGSLLATVSYGKEKPLCTESTEECWAQNRRAHFLSRPS